jgi:bacterioferritin
MFKTSNKISGDPALIELLNQILKLEYSFIVNYPRLGRMIKDTSTRILVNSLGLASIRHADVVADASHRLGGNPISHFESIPDNPDLVDLFTQQLDKENLALSLHQQCAELTKDEELKLELFGIADEEKAHIKTTEKIIFNLKQGAKDQELTRPFVSRVSAPIF